MGMAVMERWQRSFFLEPHSFKYLNPFVIKVLFFWTKLFFCGEDLDEKRVERIGSVASVLYCRFFCTEGDSYIVTCFCSLLQVLQFHLIVLLNACNIHVQATLVKCEA